jgi:hypothetical protein
MRPAMAAAATAADGVSPVKSAAKPTNLVALGGQGNACKSRLHKLYRGGDAAGTNTGRSHRWLIPHPSSRSRSTADCRPLLQQSSPNRGQVVQPGMSRKGITSRLTLCA